MRQRLAPVGGQPHGQRDLIGHDGLVFGQHDHIAGGEGQVEHRHDLCQAARQAVAGVNQGGLVNQALCHRPAKERQRPRQRQFAPRHKAQHGRDEFAQEGLAVQRRSEHDGRGSLCACGLGARLPRRKRLLPLPGDLIGLV
ncbi:MAG: hypothetical protein C4309_02845 [Chloroflexota bacterium]